MTTPALDERVFRAQRFWIMRRGPGPKWEPSGPTDAMDGRPVDLTPPYGWPLFERLTLGQFVPFSRIELLDLLGGPEVWTFDWAWYGLEQGDFDGAMEKRTLEWVFEHESLEVEAEVDGQRVRASWRRIRELAGAETDQQAPVNGTQLLSQPTRRQHRGRDPLLALDGKRRDLARRARKLRRERRIWRDVERLCGGYTRKTLEHWIEMLEGEEADAKRMN